MRRKAIGDEIKTPGENYRRVGMQKLDIAARIGTGPINALLILMWVNLGSR